MAIMNSSDQKSEFLFGNCPQCEGIVRIPSKARHDSYASCPHCDVTFQVSSCLSLQVPEVKFVNGTVPQTPVAVAAVPTTNDLEIDTESGEKPKTKFVVPPQLAAGIKKRKRRRSRSSGSSSSSRVAGTEAEESRNQRRIERAEQERIELKQKRELAKKAQKSRRSSSSRHSSSGTGNDSGQYEILKIAIGGMLAIPIAYLLLMWGFSRDPFSLAPTINSVMPSLVPSAMAPQDEPSDTAPASEDEGSSSRSGIPLPLPEQE